MIRTMLDRRRLLRMLGAAAVMVPRRAAAEPPPETKRIRLALTDSICQAPQYVAESLLQAEGFTDVRYVKSTKGADTGMASGDIDLSMTFIGPALRRIDAGDPVVVLGGGHIGCIVLFAHDEVRTIKDLKGKSVLVYDRENPPHIFLAIAMAQVGLDHRTDITLVTRPPAEALRLFEDRKVDAFAASPPLVQDLRLRKIGRVIVDSTADRPWSQYYCCMMMGNRDFVRAHPVATKRAFRAIMKSADVCALEPERAAQTLADRGFTKRYDLALQMVKDLPYRAWREYDPEDTIRFYALRLREAGMIKSAPQKLIAQGTDWRFFNELKKELKG